MGEVMDEKALQRVGQGEREFVQQAAGEMRGVDVERRVVSAVISTEDRVPMYDWDLGVCERVTLSAGMGLFRSEPIPFVDSHRTGSIQHALGSARGIRDEVQSGGGVWKVCELHFLQDDPLAERAWQLREQGHVKAVSVGLWLLRSGRVVIDPETTATVQGRVFEAGKVPLVVYTKSLLEEVSMVQTGADGGAAMQSNEAARSGKENEMDPLTQNGGAPLAPGGDQPANVVQQSGGAAPVPPASPVSPASPAAQGGSGNIVPLDAAREAAAQRAATERVLAIQAHGRRAGVDDAVVLECIQSAMTADAAAAHFLELAEQSAKPVGQRVHGGCHMAQGIDTEALRVGLVMRTQGHDATEAFVRDYVAQHGDAGRRVVDVASRRCRQMPLYSLVQRALQASGVEPSDDPRELYRQAVGNTVLNNIFTDSIGARLRATYAQAPNTARTLAAMTPVSNYQVHEIVDIDSADSLSRRGRGGRSKPLSMGDGKETWQIYEFSGRIAIDRQDFVNDNLSAFTRTPEKVARACAKLEPDLFYSALLGNPTMRDSVALFHADHANLAGSGGPLNETTLAAAIKAFRTQTIKSGDHKKRRDSIDPQPRTLVVGPHWEFVARKLINSAEILNNTSSLAYGTKNVVAELGLQLVIDPRIENGVWNPVTETWVDGQPYAWYLMGDPVETPTWQMGYLASDGEQPLVRTGELSNGEHGLWWDVIHSRGVKAVDWRGQYRNAGAAS